MDVNIKFLGGARSVTGSKYLLDIGDFRLLLDCGLFQGLKELRQRNWQGLGVEVNTIDAVVLTHAHIDHSGYLPRLCKEGYQNPVYCTEPTAALLELLLPDAAQLQEEEAHYANKKGYSKHNPPLPLYTAEDAQAVFPLLRAQPFDEWSNIHERVKIRYRYAGHILGAAIVEMLIQGDEQQKKLVFSGDLGRYHDPVMYPPVAVEESDILLVESTYGNRKVEKEEVTEQLADLVNRVCRREGVVLIPAFSVGRTQTLLYLLTRLMDEGKIPRLFIYVDSPMAISATYLYKKYRVYHKLKDEDLSHGHDVFNHPQIRYYRTQQASMSLNDLRSPAIIISASGMCTGGRILHHLYHRLPRYEDMVLFVGYQAEGTRGRDLLEGKEMIKIFGEHVPVHAEVAMLPGLSAHADSEELLRWLSNFHSAPKYTFVVHGEAPAAAAMKEQIENRLKWKHVVVPNFMESFRLFDGI
ncbi:metallo-beta-lactamase family protein [Thermonema lapsum]|uniref:Metallo-beta-lactamase family protein n=1 Tax=Thermonema lapsum TaxID=28195 RepID=A0A846MN21_9BACT|nr:MBL fold metallo-hydrolase [Thermonema lapsum]NIK72767.1 metallo-beta-lactamase family protein [Thermonema lapsum]